MIVPLDDDHLLRYYAWVADRRAHVRERSGGRLGYVHLPDQGSRGWAEFHRDLATQTSCEGLIVDTRANGGGNTSPLVVEQLMRRVTGWDLARGRTPRSYPPAGDPRAVGVGLRRVLGLRRRHHQPVPEGPGRAHRGHADVGRGGRHRPRFRLLDGTG